MSATLDPVSLEILSNALRSVTDETYVALMKSAYSTNIKERHDHSTAIMDPRGRLVVQAEQSLPIHIASMSGLMSSLLEKYGDDLREGDIFVANDPHVAGGTHLPDVNLAMPVFLGGRPIAFLCNIAHHADIGGMAPGSMAGGMSEIYQEGLRIPVVKLFREGELQQDLLDLLLLNVRVPGERRGDYFAQIAACRLGARRIREVVSVHGAESVSRAFGEIIERTESRMRDAIESIPDGVYEFEDVMDGDGLDARAIPIRVCIRVAGRHAHFDFGGTAAQVPGNVNVTLNATRASVCYSLKALLDPEVPNNEGVLNVAEIAAEPGSLLNAVFPASVASRAHTCQRIVDVVLGALAPALPGRVVAAANGANTTAVFAGVDPRGGNPYVYLETLGGGMGARPDRDGKDGVQVHITNTSNLPVEAIEAEYPCGWRSTASSRTPEGPADSEGVPDFAAAFAPSATTACSTGWASASRTGPGGFSEERTEPPAASCSGSGTANRARCRRRPASFECVPSSAWWSRPREREATGLLAEREVERVEADVESGKFSAAFTERPLPALSPRAGASVYTSPNASSGCSCVVRVTRSPASPSKRDPAMSPMTAPHIQSCLRACAPCPDQGRNLYR